MSKKKNNQSQQYAAPRRQIPVSNLLCLLFCLLFFGFMTIMDRNATMENLVFVQGEALALEEGETLALDVSQLGDSITFTVELQTGQSVKINGEKVTDSYELDISQLSEETDITIQLSQWLNRHSCTVKLIP